MRIKKIRLTNGYKRFRDLTIDLGEAPPKVVALVGPNGSGKSSVFDGMLYMQGGYSHIGDSYADDPRYHSMDSNPRYNDRRKENVQIIFDTGIYEDTYQKLHAADKGKTIFSFRSPYRYSSNLKVHELRNIPDLKLMVQQGIFIRD
ncbi:MAG TPA: AAA family ATPase [Sphingobacteriaceae bacterium]